MALILGVRTYSMPVNILKSLVLLLKSEAFPTLTRSSNLHHQQHGRCVMGKGVLQVQGIPALSQELGLEIRVPWAATLDDLTDADVARLAGNSVIQWRLASLPFGR